MRVALILPALLPFISTLPWSSDDTVAASSKPFYCGPEQFADITTNNGTIPSKVNRRVGLTTSREMTRYVDFVYNTSILTEEEFRYVVNVACFLEMPYHLRVEAVATALLDRITTSDRRLILLEARRATSRLQNFAENLKMVQVDPKKILNEAVRTVWRGNWKELAQREKEQVIWKIVEKDLCNIYVNQPMGRMSDLILKLFPLSILGPPPAAGSLAAAMRHFPRKVKHFMARYLLATNMVSAGLIFGLGDFLEQVISGHMKKLGWEMKQSLAFAGAGIASTPTTYLFYRTLERIHFAGSRRQIVMKKLFFDMCTNPLTTAYIIIAAALFEGKSFDVARREWKLKFWEYFSVDIFVWPMANYINFYYLPFKFRLIYLNTIGLIYGIVLASIRKRKLAEVRSSPID